LAAQSLNDRILAIVGPTASGKTGLALVVARRVGAEVVSADMGQMYREVDAGTAKPPGGWSGGVFQTEGIPLHMTDILDPGVPTDAGAYARRAGAVLEDIRKRGRPAIVAGGTGLYLRALLHGLDPLPPRDPAVRERLLERARREGVRNLHAELGKVDPAAAGSIPETNTHRVVRALEVLEAAGRPISSYWTGGESDGSLVRPAVYVGLRWEPAALRDRIRRRAEAMFPEMVREVRVLVPDRFTGDEPAFRCLGYREALAAARGETTEEEGLAAMIRTTAAYAKRQRTWFRRQVPTRWLEGTLPLEELAQRAIKLWNA